ncbi:hypothetical protein GTP38_25400 [Duganella sp. FT94W]|uniref:DUF4258 domain-containing protein n=1 Tax=Duganella lactea TaxID=2692173 RepID=A0ABW9VFL7_9BURK|nr:hypothetical protein [Duganella lactea]MYM37665.1 hypothetical protein [Duganella lactea]
MINITKRGWQHILRYHTNTQSPTHANKSKFNTSEDLVQLINQATQHPPNKMMRKHLVRIFDVGHEVGIDRRSQKQTSVVTVVTRLNGDLVNMFPGLP